jgi:hypothetical protein
MDRQPLTDRLGDRLLAEYGGAAAAYSLRALNGNGDNVVRVRRASDNDEKDFTAEQIELGEMVNWVNSQNVPPLDIGVETSEGRIPVPEGGTSIGTPAAAYSLRNLSSSYAGDVVKVRRNTDGSERDFSASEVSDGTLTAWVNTSFADALPLDTASGASAAYSLRSLGTNQWSYGGDTVTYTSDFSAGVDGWRPDSASSATTTSDPVGTLDVLKYTIDAETSAKFLALQSLNVGQQYLVQTEVYIPSSNVDLDSIVLMDGSGNMATSYLGIQRDVWVTVSTAGTANLADINIRGASGTTESAYNGFQGNGTDVFYVRNVVISESLGDSNDLPAGKYVTQVRRTSDDQVRSFTATEVSDGALTDWVNTDVDITDRLIVPANDGTYYVVTSSTDSSNYTVSVNNTSGVTRFSEMRSGLFQEGRYKLTGTIEVTGLTGQIFIQTNGGAAGATVNTELSEGTNDLDFEFDVIGDGSTTTARLPRLYWMSLTGASATSIVSSNLTWQVISADGHVSKWYDQSGNDNHATQGTAAKQPKIVDAGVLVTRNGNAAIQSTSDNLMTFTLDSLSADGQQSVFGVLENDVTLQDGYGTVFQALSTSEGAGGANRRPYWFIIPEGVLRFTVDSLSGYLNSDRNYRLYSHIMNDDGGGTSTVHSDGTQVDTRTITLDANSTFLQGRIAGVTTNATGALYMSELIYYTSDQTDKRRAIEENIGDHYGITLGSFSRDGHVSKWYDQSGNDNHAVQTTPANQPTIVEGGSLVTGGIDFDGVNDGLFTASNLTDTLQSATIFALTQDDTTSGVASMVRIRPNGELGTSDGIIWEKTTGDTYAANTLIEGANGAVTGDTDGQGTRNTFKNLNTLVYQQSQILAYENGALDATLNDVSSGSAPVGDVTLVDQLWIGQNFDDNARPFNGTMSEVIIYFTDQSDNRTAIEANIGETYGITGIPAYDNTVDGFVETWYDQSGNGNDATQGVAGNQPKIVDAGVLVSGGIDFDGVDDYFVSSHILSSDDVLSLYAVGAFDDLTQRGRMVGDFFYVDISDNGGFVLENKAFGQPNRIGGYGDDILFPQTAASFVTEGSESLLEMQLVSGSSSFYVNGSNVNTISATMNSEDGGSVLSIGASAAGTLPLLGQITEIIIYNADKTSDMANIRGNINAHYDIYP